MLSKEQIDRLDWLAHGATAGDWNFGTYANGVLITTTERDKHNPIAKVVGEYAVPWDKTPLSAQTYNNAEYIAAANPQTVSELIAMLREAQKDAAKCRSVLEHINRCIPAGGFVQIHSGSATAADIDAVLYGDDAAMQRDGDGAHHAGE